MRVNRIHRLYESSSPTSLAAAEHGVQFDAAREKVASGTVTIRAVVQTAQLAKES